VLVGVSKWRDELGVVCLADLKVARSNRVSFKAMNIFKYTDKTTSLPSPTAKELPPSWKGFNFLNMFYIREKKENQFNEIDFKIISGWGFNFVRLPIDYRILILGDDWNSIDENAMLMLDKAVEYGIKYDVHVCINFHRAPGYTVAYPPEKTNLWTEEEPQKAFADLWQFLAARYTNIPNKHLSFNLVNEPANIDEASYSAVVKIAANAIWEKDPGRLVIADGLEYGTIPSDMNFKTGVAQSTRGYQPFTLTHYKANWVKGSEEYPLPKWPSDEVSFNRTSLYETHFKQWEKLKNSGCGLMAGEWGAHNRTPHDVVLKWMEDCLEIFKSMNIGWSLWNLIGSFGILNSGRTDVDYEDFNGYKLDRKMLNLLQKYLD